MPSDKKDRVLVIDPDSRISQLGLLPLTIEGNYLFFNSRGGSLASSHLSMAELANRWFDSVFGLSGFCYPKVWAPSLYRLRAKRMAAVLRDNGCKKIVSVNFGIGGNPRKRVDSEFESKLLLQILNVPGTVIILDKGFGDEELSRSNRLLQLIKSRGHETAQFDFEHIDGGKMTHGIISVQCGIGEMASLISVSDQFIGYDSACQHISAALGIPTVTVFAGTNNMGFMRRWSACGNTRCNIVHVNTLEHPLRVDIDDVVLRIMAEVTAAERRPPGRPIADAGPGATRDAVRRPDVLDEVS